jgi:hypothetical protein
VISIALATNTDPEAWWRQDYRTIITAAEMLQTAKNTDSEGRLMAG